jgi:rfaE bifunctional protein nucleotidyltransferase chain/domain
LGVILSKTPRAECQNGKGLLFPIRECSIILVSSGSNQLNIMLDEIRKKIMTIPQACAAREQYRNAGEEVVFTNGCFDIMHYGHVNYLANARGLGDRLIVGLNSGASVTKLKGEGRPINDELTRQHVLASLMCVDAVVIFKDDTPYDLIKRIEPDILVKGGDWKVEDIVGADVVKELGGQVMNIPFIPGYSTTNIIRRIRTTDSLGDSE